MGPQNDVTFDLKLLTDTPQTRSNFNHGLAAADQPLNYTRTHSCYYYSLHSTTTMLRNHLINY